MIFSRALRQVILIELTVPLEDRVCVGHERKRNRFLQLLSLCQSNGMQLIFQSKSEVGVLLPIRLRDVSGS